MRSTYHVAGAIDDLRAVEVLVGLDGVEVLDDAFGAIVAGRRPAQKGAVSM